MTPSHHEDSSLLRSQKVILNNPHVANDSGSASAELSNFQGTTIKYQNLTSAPITSKSLTGLQALIATTLHKRYEHYRDANEATFIGVVSQKI